MNDFWVPSSSEKSHHFFLWTIWNISDSIRKFVAIFKAISIAESPASFELCRCVFIVMLLSSWKSLPVKQSRIASILYFLSLLKQFKGNWCKWFCCVVFFFVFFLFFTNPFNELHCSEMYCFSSIFPYIIRVRKYSFVLSKCCKMVSITKLTVFYGRCAICLK